MNSSDRHVAAENPKNTHVEKVNQFLEIGQTELRGLEAAIESGDTIQIRSYVRRLCEVADQLGLREVSDCAEKVGKNAYRGNLGGTLESHGNLQRCLDVLEKNMASTA